MERKCVQLVLGTVSSSRRTILPFGKSLEALPTDVELLFGKDAPQ